MFYRTFILFLFISIFCISISRTQDISEPDVEVIIDLAENTIMEYHERINLIALGILTDPQTERIIEDLFLPITIVGGVEKDNKSQVFSQDARIDDDILEPGDLPDSAKNINIEIYLKNFQHFYDKSQEISFSNIETGPIREKDYLYIQVRYDKKINGKNLNYPGKEYPRTKRVAELKIEKTNGKWKTLITRISFARLEDDDRDNIDNFFDVCPETLSGTVVNKEGCPDLDQDGISDIDDSCPATQFGCAVDLNGCQLDDDNDGICNEYDQCADTPAGCIVGPDGCLSDTDKDGICDNLDLCPGTLEGVSVNSTGCPNDLDNDGVPDEVDKCLDTKAGCAVDSYGCIIDSDGDGICDNLDECPNSKSGLRVNQNGCSVDKRRIGINYTFLGDPWESFPLSNLGLAYYGNSVNPVGIYVSGITYFNDIRPEHVYSSQQIANIVAGYQINELQYTPLTYLSTQANLFAFETGLNFKPFPSSLVFNGLNIKIGYSYLNGEIWEIHSGVFGDEVATSEEGVYEYAINYSNHKSGNFTIGGVLVIRFLQFEFGYNHLYNSFNLCGGFNIGF